MKITPSMWQAAAVVSFAACWMPAARTQQSSASTKPSSIEISCNSARFKTDYELGEKSLHADKAGAALPYLENAYHLCPSSYGAGRDLIIAYGKSGSMPRARAVAVEMLRNGDVPELHSVLGELFASAGDVRSAAEQYQKAAKLDPNEENVFEFGSSLLKFESGSAIQIFRFGVDKFPNSEKMHVGLGSALYGQGLMDEGVAEVFKASELYPKDPQPMEVLGQMEHIPSMMSAEIIARFSSLCALYPHNARLTYDYAMALSGRWSEIPAADSTEIVALLRTATELDPGFAEAYFQLGEFYQEEDRSLDALHVYQRAAKLNPQQERYHYRLALSYKKCGHIDEYRKEMEIYQRLHENAH